MKWIFRLALVIGLAGLSRSNPANKDAEIDSSEFGQFVGEVLTNCTCGITNKDGARIVGGRETLRNEYPHMVGIGYWNGKTYDNFCGGSSITHYHVLTAAHCMHGENINGLGVAVGMHDVRETQNTKKKNIYRIAKNIMHDKWNPRTWHNDVAIIVLKEKIAEGLATPICLPRQELNLVGDYVKVTGWGDTSSEGTSSKVLLKVNLRVVAYNDCKDKYVSKEITPNHLCTLSKNKDSCQGDSGGPVIWLDPETNRYTQVGVVSFGMGCAFGRPSISSNVYSYIGWIQKTVAEHEAKVKTCASEGIRRS